MSGGWPGGLGAFSIADQLVNGSSLAASASAEVSVSRARSLSLTLRAVLAAHQLGEPVAPAAELAAALDRLDRGMRLPPMTPVALWAAHAPHPTDVVDEDTWRRLFAAVGYTDDGFVCARPESLTLLRASTAERARGWSWTTEPSVARFHAEGATRTSDRTHASPRVWRTEAPTEALLASLPAGLEGEVVVDPVLLGDVEEVSPQEWRSFPAPITVDLSDGRVAITPPIRGVHY